MKRTIFFILLIVFQFKLVAQDQARVNLTIDRISLDSKKFELEINIINTGLKDIVLYKPSVNDIQWSVLKIYAVSMSDKTRKHDFFPFNEIIDLESINLNNHNTIRLSNNEGFIKILNFSINDFSPYLTDEKYMLYVELNYSIANFETDIPNVLNSDLTSEGYLFKLCSKEKM